MKSKQMGKGFCGNYYTLAPCPGLSREIRGANMYTNQRQFVKPKLTVAASGLLQVELQLVVWET